MMEDKENTRPREKKVVEIRCDDSEKLEKPNKEKKETMTKIVIRRLPPSLTKEQLEEQLQPLPEVDYLEFFSNDTSLYPHLFSRAYINFKNQDDVVLFRDRFDGYVFVDNRGQEYPAIVEFAPFQKIAKKRSKKKDAKAGTIDEDADYKKFLENYNRDDEKFTSTPETLLEEIEAKTKELGAKKTTPLLDFLKNKQRIREEKKEERRKRELERKRLRDEERRKWREEDRRKRKEAEKQKKGEKNVDREREESKEEPKIKLLRKPEKGDDAETESKVKDKPKKSEDRSSGMEFKKRPNGENREDRGRRQDEDGRKEHRDWDMDRERERERRQREKDRIIRRQEEERRKKRERHEAESSFRKRDEDTKKEKDRGWEKRKSENGAELGTHIEKAERSVRDDRKEDSSKRDRVRNKDRPAIQLYQPGIRSRNRAGGVDAQAEERKAESQTKSTQEKGEERRAVKGWTRPRLSLHIRVVTQSSLSPADAIVVVGFSIRHVVAQDFPDQALPGKEAEAEQTDPAVDQDEDRQQDQIQLQETTLEENQAGTVIAHHPQALFHFVGRCLHPDPQRSHGHPGSGVYFFYRCCLSVCRK